MVIQWLLPYSKNYFLGQKMEQLGKHIDKRVMLWTCNKASITEMGLCSVTTRQIAVVTEGGPALLGVPHIKTVDMKCNIIEMRRQTQEIKEYSTDENSYTKKISNLHPMINGKNK